MDMDKIIEKLRENRNDKIRESQICTRGTYSTRDMQMLADGYSMAVKDLSDLIAQQTPPCTGSSVQRNDNEKLYDFCETLKSFSKENNDKNKKLHEWITYDINIGDKVELKDGTIGEINYAGKLHKHDVYEWYFVIAIEKGKTLCLYSYDLSKDFQQIGKYNFYSEHKNTKIDKLKHDFKKVTEPSTVTTIEANGNITLEFNKMTEIYHRVPITNEQLMDKINEIIDVINKL